MASAFRRGLGEAGFAEGRFAIKARWADGQYDRLPELAAELIGRKADVLMAGGPPAANAAKAASATIPIVFTTGNDPVGTGLVASLSRPGGNVTGIYIFFTELESKKLSLLRELLPRASLIAALVNPTFPTVDTQTSDLQSAAQALGQRIQIVNVAKEPELAPAFASMAQSQVSALLVGSDPFFNTERNQIVALAKRYAIPAVYERRAFVIAGGLMSYGPDLADSYRQAGLYVGRILKEKPADLPVVQSTKFEFIINAKTAKALGIAVPSGLLAIADEVIE